MRHTHPLFMRRLLLPVSAILFAPLLTLLTLAGLTSTSALAQTPASHTPTAATATLEVNSLADTDDGVCDAAHCTLREAIDAADAADDFDIITFAGGLSGSIELDNILAIGTDMHIDGPGAEQLAIIAKPTLAIVRISGSPTISVTISGLTFEQADSGISPIQVGNAVVTFAHCTMQDNKVNGVGGALIIDAIGSATLDSCTLRNNRAIQAAGIYNAGNLTVRNSNFISNTTTGLFGEGGGIRNEGGRVTVTLSSFVGNNSDGSALANKEGGFASILDSTFDDNLGSALYNTEANLTVAESLFTNNRNPASGGGAIANGGSTEFDPGGLITVTTSTFTSNSAGDGAAIANRYGGNAHIELSTFSENTSGGWGGALFNERSVMSVYTVTVTNNRAERGGGIANRRGSTLAIYDSLISGNYASHETYGQCGGVSNDSINALSAQRLTIDNSTISGNHADTYGGGVCTLGNVAETTIRNSTLVLNRANFDDDDDEDHTGGGIYSAGGTTILASNLIASNYRGTGATLENEAQSANTPGTITSQGFNLSDSAPASFGGDDLSNVDPLFAPLDDYGGPTHTHALFAGSPAIDAGSALFCPITDQRGVARPQDGNEDATAACDIGAFEVDAVIEEPETPEGQSLYLPGLTKAPTKE